MAIVTTINNNGQLSLGPEYAGRHALIDEVEPGVWLIKIGEFVPDNERWVLEPGVSEEINRAIAWATQNSPALTDLDALATAIDE